MSTKEHEERREVNLSPFTFCVSYLAFSGEHGGTAPIFLSSHLVCSGEHGASLHISLTFELAIASCTPFVFLCLLWLKPHLSSYVSLRGDWEGRTNRVHPLLFFTSTRCPVAFDR